MDLIDFIRKKMRMSHIYQPVMIRSLIQNGGRMKTADIAKELLSYDVSQQEYYSNVVNKMVGAVLRNHNIVQKDKDSYVLSNYENLDEHQINAVVAECNKKIDEFINNRGDAVWQHRRKNRRPVPGSIRYEVLRRAGFRCELCGVSADQKALEVDHIVPKNFGGEDEIHNYQALCYTCNAQKRDTDQTDFRGLVETYNHRDERCVFCSMKSHSVVYENNLAVGFFDLYPVTLYHMLIIPKRHVGDYFGLLQPEINAINDIIKQAKQDIEAKDRSVMGFNIGANCGVHAGQTILHCHLHLIPRRAGDVEDPIGGVRNVIPGQGNYKKFLH